MLTPRQQARRAAARGLRMARAFDLLNPLFNLREIAKHLLLLEDHLQLHYCDDCIRKHLMTVEAFAEEASALDVAGMYTVITAPLAETARTWLEQVADAQDSDRIRELAQEVRQLRKSLVPMVYDPRSCAQRVAAAYLARGSCGHQASVPISDKTLTKRFRSETHDPRIVAEVEVAVRRIPSKFLKGLREIILFPPERASFYVDPGADGEYQPNTRTVMVAARPSLGTVRMVVCHEVGHHVSHYILSREQQVAIQEQVGFRIEDWGEDFASCFGFYFAGQPAIAQRYPHSFRVLRELL